MKQLHIEPIKYILTSPLYPFVEHIKNKYGEGGVDAVSLNIQLKLDKIEYIYSEIHTTVLLTNNIWI